jgi:hypothetical protein
VRYRLTGTATIATIATIALSAHEHPLNDLGHIQDASSAARLHAEDPNQNREYTCAVIRVDVLLLDR